MKKKTSLKVLRIAIPSPLRRSFDYLPPTHCDPADLIPGIRVQVPFGSRREVIGILLEVVSETEIQEDKLKPAVALVDQTPVWPSALLTLGQWASQYYNHPIGDVLVGTLPTQLRLGKEIEAERSPSTLQDKTQDPPLELNAHQAAAINTIVSTDGFKVFLLDGITGSGKTEVYLQVIAQQLQQGKQALVLVPEIALTPQILARFEERFSVPIAVLHSGLNNKQRATAWSEASQGNAAIIIGTRSAVFTPMARPGVIILDEEHDPSFKQQSGFRYSARDVATMRGRLENIPVILGSATPSLESLRNASAERYQRLCLPARAGSARSPSIQLLDMRGLPLEHGLSVPLLTLIQQHLDQQGQVLLFLNRRGYSPVLLCHECAWSAACKRCDAKLTLHQSPKRLHCHHCETVYTVYSQCPECKSKSLMSLGLGTERLEEGLQKHFPHIDVLRMDSDTTSGKGKLNKLLDKIYAGTTCIITGTQMLAKGHHFPHVTMVAVVDADSGLYSTDFRASERMAQLIVQVAGRAGRGNKQGQVIVQTHNPHHPVLQGLVSQGYHHFAQEQLKERQTTALPPYAYLALIRAEAIHQSLVYEFLKALREDAQTIQKSVKHFDIKIGGPVPAAMERKAGRFRAHLLFQAENRHHLQQFLGKLMPYIEKKKPSRQLRWSIDVDPIEVI